VFFFPKRLKRILTMIVKQMVSQRFGVNQPAKPILPRNWGRAPYSLHTAIATPFLNFLACFTVVFSA